jgi:hypothetical protein
MSLTFEQRQGSSSGEGMFSDPDNMNGPDSNPAQPLISIADSAFGITENSNGQYMVNLVVNVAGVLPSWLQMPSNPWGGYPVGFSPVLVNPYVGSGSATYYTTYPLWQVPVTDPVTETITNYTVLDLTTIPNPSTVSPNALNSSGNPITVPSLSIGSTSADDLLLQIRTVLPATSFACAGQNVPYSAAAYTGTVTIGEANYPYSTLMGAYVPYVSVWAPGGTAQAPPAPNLPTSDVTCGTIPVTPFVNTPISASAIQ